MYNEKWEPIPQKTDPKTKEKDLAKFKKFEELCNFLSLLPNPEIKKDTDCPWVVSYSSDDDKHPLHTVMEVRLSDKFANEQEIKIRQNRDEIFEQDPPIFRFYLRKYNKSYENPLGLEKVEINLIKDSNFENRVEYQHWGINYSTEGGFKVTKPKEIFMSEQDLFFAISKITKNKEDINKGAKSFVKFEDLAETRKVVRSVALFGVGALLFTKGILLAKEKRENPPPDLVNETCKKLKDLGEPKLAQIYKNLFNYSQRWGLDYEAIDIAFINQVKDIKSFMEYLAEGRISLSQLDTLNTSEPIPSVETFFAEGQKEIVTKDEDAMLGNTQVAVQSFVTNLFKVFPFLAASSKNIQTLISAPRNYPLRYFFDPSKKKINIPVIVHGDLSNHDTTRISTHEIKHVFSGSEWLEITKVITPRQYISLVYNQAKLSSKMLEQFISEYIPDQQEVIFGDWGLNSY